MESTVKYWIPVYNILKQNCLTLPNFKLDDVFSDMFGKAASAITTQVLENSEAKITDASSLRTKLTKAAVEEILAAVDERLKNELKSSALSIPTWTAWNCASSIWNP